LTITYLAAQAGEPVWVLGSTRTIKVRHTAYTVIESTDAPGSGLPPHALDGQDQSVYVLAGTYELVAGDERLALGPGEVAFIPRGTVHRLTVSGSDPARCLVTVTPPGAAETFLDEVRGSVGALSASTDADEILAIARRAGIALLTSPV
jgi:quercetin dioxygenase-like cupin family protein